MSEFRPQAPLPGYEKLLPVSNAPVMLADSKRVGWHGASYSRLMTASTGRVDHAHSAMSLQRLHAPMHIRRAGTTSWKVFPPGLRLYMPSDEFHFDWKLPEPTGLELLFIAPQQAEHVLERSFDPQSFQRWTAGLIEAPRIALLIAALQQDLAQGSPAGRLVGDCLIAALVAHLSEPPASSEVLGGRRLGGSRSVFSPGLRAAVIERFRVRLDEPPSLAELAALARMSQRHFCRVFHATFGMPPHQYLLQLRVERARGLLRESDHGLADIALQLGFADQSQFSHTFKRLSGVTPSRYRIESRR